MIKLKDITYRYPGGKYPALIGINAEISPGIYLMAGENGAGKTTLLHVMAGIIRPLEGECLIDGISPALDKVAAKGRTFLLEENTEFPMKTIREFAEAHSRFYPNYSEHKLLANLQAFGLTGSETMKNLSLGTRKKTQLAYALALGVDVLLLDEPTNALDIETKETLKSLLASSIEDGQTVVISTHTVSELENLFDGAMLMRGAHLLWAGTESDATERLAFRSGRAADLRALYSEVGLNSVKSICQADPGEETAVDWKLLYSALHSEKYDKVLSALSSTPHSTSK